MKTFRFLLIAVVCILAGGRGIALGQCVPSPSGIVAWWPLDETSSPANDLAGVNNTGTWMNNPTPVSGKVAGALSFDNDYVEVQGHSELDFGEGDLTIDAWVKRDTASTNSPPSMIVDKRDPVSGIGYSLSVSYGRLIFLMSGTNYATTTYPVPADDQWHHVAVTVNRVTNVVQFYGNGIPLDALPFTSPPGNLNNTNSFWIGKGQLAGNQPWLGCIDELELFNRALDSTEVQAIFSADSLGKCKPLVDSLPPCETPDQVIEMNISTGLGLPGPGSQDPQWHLVAVPGQTGVFPAYSTNPRPGWVIPPFPVHWIQRIQNANPQSDVPGVYTYRLLINLDPAALYSSIQIVGQYSADNAATVLLNGNPLPSSCPGPNCFQNWKPFPTTNLISQFTPGLNFLEIQVTNNELYTGLVVDAKLRAICARNHYKTWRIQPLPFDTTVFVQDQFNQDTGMVVRLDTIDFLSNPVKKIVANDTFNITRPNDHLTWYRAKSFAPTKRFKVQYVNQFESTTLVMDTLRYLLLPTQKDPHPKPDSLLGHYTAYRIKNPKEFSRSVQLQDQFDPTPEFIDSLMPVYFLTPAQKNNEPRFEPDTHYVAYEIFPKRVAPQTRTTLDQFGSHFMQIRQSELLLVPTNKVSVKYFKAGDANGDGKITVSDVVFLINYLFKGGSAPDPVESGDVNCDGKVSVSDVVYLINYLFKGGPPPR